MARTRDTRPDDPKLEKANGLTRRDFVKTGAAAGLGAGALLEPDQVAAQVSASSTGTDDITWDYDVDVVIAGAGCVGLTGGHPRAGSRGSRAGGRFELRPCGRMIPSGAFLSLGGGDPVQRRDMKGESDHEGFITVDPTEAPEELDDNVDLLFTDLTDWSVLDTKAQSPYRYNERELARSWAENCPATRQFLIDNYVRFTRVSGTHGGGGLSRAARRALLSHAG